MSSPYIGEIRIFAGSFAPAGWAMCDGQLMPISQNDAMFVLLGTTYGGDGQETFGIPDLQGRFPIHMGTGGGATYTLGEKAGTESVTLTTQQMPSHNHPPLASLTTGDAISPQDGVWAAQGALNQFFANPTQFDTPMAPNTVSIVGGSQPHENMSPYLVLTFIISLFGIFPSPQ